jgi:hypothetical protein
MAKRWYVKHVNIREVIVFLLTFTQQPDGWQLSAKAF